MDEVAVQRKIDDLKERSTRDTRTIKKQKRKRPDPNSKKLTEEEVKKTLEALNFVKDNSSERNQSFSI